jgi:hypothetical protein
MGEPSVLAGLIANPFLACLLLFAIVVGAMELGRFFSRNNTDSPGTGAINGAIFAILGLILAFSFSGAASRFDQRRDLIVAEANAIGTALLRVDLLPDDAQPAVRADFKRYVDARIAAYAPTSDTRVFRQRLREANAISAEIWKKSVAAGKRPDALPAVNILLLPALNAMIDITASRAAATLMHPPAVIRYLLIVLAAVAAFLAGSGFRNRSQGRLHELAFALIMTATIFITIDLEYPRIGFIRVENFEQAVIDFSRGNGTPKGSSTP